MVEASFKGVFYLFLSFFLTIKSCSMVLYSYIDVLLEPGHIKPGKR